MPPPSFYDARVQRERCAMRYSISALQRSAASAGAAPSAVAVAASAAHARYGRALLKDAYMIIAPKSVQYAVMLLRILC